MRIVIITAAVLMYAGLTVGTWLPVVVRLF